MLYTLLFINLEVSALLTQIDQFSPDLQSSYIISIEEKVYRESLVDQTSFSKVIDISSLEGKSTTLIDILRRQVGVNIYSTGGLGSRSQTRLRGAESDQVVVYLDGIRLNSAIGSGVDLSTIPVENIERIEIIKGGNSSIAGSGAMGGVVNIITRSPDGIGGSIKFNYSSFTTCRSACNLTYNKGNLEFSSTLSYQFSKGDFPYIDHKGTLTKIDDHRENRGNNDFESTGALLKLTYNSFSRIFFKAMIEYYHDWKGIPGMEQFLTPAAKVENERWLFAGGCDIEHLLADLDMLQFTISHLTNGNDYRNPSAGFGALSNSEQKSKLYSASIRYKVQLPVFKSRNIENWQMISLFNEYNYETLSGNTLNVPIYKNYAASIKDDIHYSLNFHFLKMKIVISPVVRYDNFSEYGSRITPGAGCCVSPSDCIIFKANWERSFRKPSLVELFSYDGFVVPNSELSSEKSTSYDAGFILKLLSVQLETAFFRTDYEDLIQYELVTGFRFKPFNVGRARIRGIEVQLDAEINENFDFTIGYTLLETEIQSGNENERGNHLTGRPEQTLTGELNFHSKYVHPYFSMIYIGESYINRANTKSLSENVRFNFGVRFHINEHWEASFDLKNATNEYTYDLRGYPLPPRSFHGSIRFSF